MTFNRRALVFSLSLALAAPAFAQPPASTPAPTPAPQTANSLPRVALETAAGRIVIEVDTVRAPITANNFLRYVDAKRYDGAEFYRAFGAPDAPNFGFIQGGLNKARTPRFPAISHEPTTQTGILHKAGAISMGRNAPGTATSEFFIMVGDTTSLDANPAAEGDNLGYAAFGRVVEGMDVVRTIQHFPTSPEAEVEAMRNQMLVTPLKITSAHRVTP